MRKLVATLFTSMDDVVEAPDGFVRGELYEGLPAALDTIAQLEAQPGAHCIRLAQHGCVSLSGTRAQETNFGL
ncbi:MAG: hypothetical protein ING64_08875 [Rhodocyclaceae bacterium]|nr:hypothetical protein [Rhodocyclaceae bacterium]MCA3021807.1 hypothetical protein [Rhodocyclaceae bacterium]MCA3056456.1 hypothetical protein [Rhodocyclaceae bacterium]